MDVFIIQLCIYPGSIQRASYAVRHNKKAEENSIGKLGKKDVRRQRKEDDVLGVANSVRTGKD